MKRVIAGLFFLCASPIYALVEYDFSGVSERGNFTGYLSFDVDQATQDDPQLPHFNLPGSMWFKVGEKTFAGNPWKATASRNAFDFSEIAIGNNITSCNSNFWITGNLFDNDPMSVNDLKTAHWDLAQAPDRDFEMSTYGDEDTGGFWYRIQQLTMRKGNQNLILADAAPTPEPSGFILLASALAGLTGFRFFRRRKIQREAV